MSQLHLNITVTGLVQGVFFRKHTQEKALALGLTGFCRNEADGTVYIEVEGQEDAVLEFTEWCYKGSPKSKVKAVQSAEGPVKGFEGFQIAYSS